MSLKVHSFIYEYSKKRPLFLQTDSWHRHMASSEIERDTEFSEAVLEGDQRLSHFLIEMYAELYDGPLRPCFGAASWATTVLEKIKETSEWGRLAAECNGISWQASIAAYELGKVAQKILDDAEKEKERREKEEQEKREQQQSDPSSQPQNETPVTAEEILEQIAQKVNVEEVMAEVADEASDIRETLISLGMKTTGTGMLAPCAQPPENLIEAIRKSEEFKNIAQLAGRLYERLDNEQQSVDVGGMDNFHQLVFQNSLENAVASEYVGLCDEDLENLVYYRLSQGAIMANDYMSRRPMSLGPMIVCIDESGSMVEGDRNTKAKACLIALAKFAAKRRRPFMSVHFDHTVSRTVTVRGDITAAALDSWAKFSNGGTDIGLALSSANKLLVGEFARADVLVITDGFSPIPPIRTEVKELHKKNARVFSLSLGSTSEFKSVFDKDYDLESDVETALSEVAIV